MWHDHRKPRPVSGRRWTLFDLSPSKEANLHQSELLSAEVRR